MNKIGWPFFICSLVLCVSACTIIGSVKDIYNTNVNPQKYSFGEKSLIFVPIVHFGQKEYYSNLKDSIVLWKSYNYTVFYEEVGTKGSDKKALELYNRKWRKINGGTGKTRADYAKLEEAFEGGIPQPEYGELGIDERDINADISFEQLIDKYEAIYGEVKLDDCDRATAFDATYECGAGLKNDLSPVLVDFRNDQLAQRIVNSNLQNIIIVYGKDHMKGVQEILQRSKPLTN